MNFTSIIESLTKLTGWLVPLITMVIAILVYMSRGKVKFGKLILDFEQRTRTERAVNEVEDTLAGSRLEPSERQYRLLRAYHTQSLAQSRTSMWFSLVFAALGFAVIVTAIFTIDSSVNKIIKLTSGTIIDAVAGLFFVQSNKARELMAAFFDKLRTDRKLDESLKLVSEMQDATLRSRLQMLLSINFAGVQVDNNTLLSLVGISGSTAQSPAADTPIDADALKRLDEPAPPLQNVTAFPVAGSGSKTP